MPSIEQDIKAIRTAIYGKDVREAIADGIEKCNKNTKPTVSSLGVVSYENAQSLTEAQKQQARTNIGLGSVAADVDTALANANTAKTTAESAQSLAESASDVANSASTTANLVRTLAETAYTTANIANDAANTAKTSAQSAVSTANSAKATADSAKTSAENAVSTANNASAVANSIRTLAETAYDTAYNASTVANRASSIASEAKLTAEDAQTMANNATTAAGTAQTAANEAITAAEMAQATADDAYTTASEAQTAADNASTAASTAQSTADAAQAAANAISTSSLKAVSYEANQGLTDAEKTNARTNINAASSSDIGNPVTNVSESNGTVTIVKKDGTTSTFIIPFGLTFNGGYCETDPLNGKTYLHLTMDEEDIDDFDPIEIPATGGESEGLAFDGGYCAKDETDGVTYLYLTKDDIRLDEEVFKPIAIPATGGGGDGGNVITIMNVVRPTAVRNGAKAVFSFAASDTQATTITVVWYVDDVERKTTSADSGRTQSFDAGPYLKESDQSTVKVVISSETGATLTRIWTVTSTAFSLKWGVSISPIMLYTTNDDVYVVIDVTAQARTSNIVKVTVNGDVNKTKTQTVSGSRSLTISINAGWFDVGSNRVTANLTAGDDPESYTEDIYFDAIWGYGATGPIAAFADTTIDCTQYDIVPVKYYVYDPNSETATATLQIDSEAPREINPGREIQTYYYSPQEPGTVTMTLTSGSSTATVTLNVVKSSYDIGIVKGDNLRYNLDPVGHSNNDADKTSFGNITFSNGFDWVNGGFQTDEEGRAALVVKKGHRATLPRSLFADSDINGKTIDISFRVMNSEQYDAVAMQDLNNGQTKGLILKANEGVVRYNNATGQIFRYCEGTKIDLSIYVEAAVEQRLATIWLDGIPSKADKYQAEMLVQAEKPLIIGSDQCDVWVYAIRVYNSALSEREMVQNYIANGDNMDDKIARYEINDIFDENGILTPASLHAAAKDLTIITIAAPRMSLTKKDPIAADVTIQDGDTILELHKASANDAKDGTVFKVQGTSSVTYARSSLNMDIDFKGTGETYKLSENSIPVNYLNIKVNVASSENANNVCAVDWYNTYQPFLIEARKNNSSIRDTVEGKPCAVFFTNTGTETIWVSSQQIAPQQTILYVMGDLCNSKKNTEVFGEDGTGTHYTKACIEVSGNDTAAQQFRATAEYSYDREQWDSYDGLDDDGNPKYKKHFEWRMEPSSEDLEDVISSWNTTVAWVVSTINDSDKFYTELHNYFTVDSMLYHFLMIEYFAAYDNVSKNTFYSYDWDENEQGYRWNIKEAYDWDTILACDNDGFPLGDYGIDYGDIVSGNKGYFNASNPIWLNIQSKFKSELSDLYITLRGLGTWNSTAILKKWDSYQAKRPHAAMVQDAYIKYIYPYKTNGVTIGIDTYSYDDAYLARLQGSKTYQRRQFLTYQTAYMDGKYGYASKSEGTQFRTNVAQGSTQSFIIKTYAKTYITVIADTNTAGSKKIEAGGTATFENVSVGSNTTVYVTPDRLVQYIRPLNETDNTTFAASGAAKLMEVVLGGENENQAWPASNGLAIPSAILKTLNIRNLVNFASSLDLSNNAELETLDTRGTNTGSIILAPYAPLTSIQLNSVTGLTMSNLTKTVTFTLESGDNLDFISMENCNDLIEQSILTYLQQSYASASQGTKSLRLVGVNWDLSSKDLLNNLLKAQSIDAFGKTGPAPCVLTGHVFVSSASVSEKEAYDAAWPGVVEVESLESEYQVRFLNADGNPILDSQGNPYVQNIIANSYPYDPSIDGIPNPTMEATAQYIYTFTGWYDLNTPVTANRDVIAKYSTITKTYTVRYIAYRGGPVLQEDNNVPFGAEIVYTGVTPTRTEQEANLMFYVFTGWDKSTGFVRENIDVYGTWDLCVGYPQVGTDLKDMTPSQIYALTKYLYGVQSGTDRIDAAEQYLAYQDYITITMGRDYNFSNVDSTVLVSEPEFFDGTGGRVIDLAPFAEDRNFTLAIEYEFLEDTDNATLMSFGYEDDGNIMRGLRLRYVSGTSGGPNIQWGGNHAKCGTTYYRNIVVIRHIAGNLNIFVYRSDISSSAYDEAISTVEISREENPVSSAKILLGGLQESNGDWTLCAKGWIYWAKVWWDDLGANNASIMASFPHEQLRMEYYGTDDYILSGTIGQTACMQLICNSLLPRSKAMNVAQTNVGGWPVTSIRSFLNNRFLDGLPIWFSSLLKQVKVYSTVGGTSTSVVYSDDKVYIPARNTYAYAATFADETSDYVGYYTAGHYESGENRSAVYARIKWRGAICRRDRRYYNTTSEPTSLTTAVVEEGDIWNNPASSSYSYMYFSPETVAKHTIVAGVNWKTANTIVIAASDGGVWIENEHTWFRSPAQTNSTQFLGLTYGGGITQGYNANADLGVDPCVSL